MSNSRQTSGRSGDTFRNLMLYPFELRAPKAHYTQSLPVQASRKPDFYLRAQIRYILANLDSVKPSRVRGKVQDRLRDLARELRNSKGSTKWALILSGLGSFAFMALLAIAHHQPKIYIYQAPTDTFRVIAQDSDFNFVLQQVHEGQPQKEAVYHFCPSQLMPRFQIGETLDQLIYEEKGECQQLARGVPYIIERDLTLPGHWPKLAGNCVNLGVKQTVVCEGKPKF